MIESLSILRLDVLLRWSIAVLPNYRKGDVSGVGNILLIKARANISGSADLCCSSSTQQLCDKSHAQSRMDELQQNFIYGH